MFKLARRASKEKPRQVSPRRKKQLATQRRQANDAVLGARGLAIATPSRTSPQCLCTADSRERVADMSKSQHFQIWLCPICYEPPKITIPNNETKIK